MMITMTTDLDMNMTTTMIMINDTTTIITTTETVTTITIQMDGKEAGVVKMVVVVEDGKMRQRINEADREVDPPITIIRRNQNHPRHHLERERIHPTKQRQMMETNMK